MLTKRIIGAIRKLFGLSTVAQETEEQRLMEKARTAFTAPVPDRAGFMSAFDGLLKLQSGEPVPVRSTPENFEIVRTVVAEGYQDDPDVETVTFRVKSTGDHVNMRLNRIALGNWQWDFGSMRLADAQGSEIQGTTVPESLRDLFVNRFSGTQPNAAPEKRFG